MASRKQKVVMDEEPVDKSMALFDREARKFLVRVLIGLAYTGYIVIVALIYHAVISFLLPAEICRAIMLITLGMPLGLPLASMGTMLMRIFLAALSAGLHSVKDE
ncbi:MAG TPA: hypothetical protein VFA09_11160 [Ktedonobacteraceae bacterium]|jgi:hypothetical protein|nr:hypothetical protein [Ktedonobacteraceae bacterium]